MTILNCKDPLIFFFRFPNGIAGREWVNVIFRLQFFSPNCFKVNVTVLKSVRTFRKSTTFLLLKKIRCRVAQVQRPRGNAGGEGSSQLKFGPPWEWGT